MSEQRLVHLYMPTALVVEEIQFSGYDTDEVIERGGNTARWVGGLSYNRAARELKLLPSGCLKWLPT